MDGIDAKLLWARTATGKSLLAEIMLGAKLTRMDASISRDYTGRYNFTTTKQHFMESVEWIDTALPAIIAEIPESELGEFEGCIERIYPCETSSVRSKATNASRRSTTSYLSALTHSFGSDDSADTAPPPNPLDKPLQSDDRVRFRR
jgi:hypothetical protein